MTRAAPSIVGHVLAIPVAEITVGKRLRPVNPIWAAALGGIMAAEGQQTPIQVCKLPGRHGYHLVSGAHRLEGHRLSGLKTINAIDVGNDALERRQREVSENLHRHELDPIDRASHVAELHELLKTKAGVDLAANPQQVAVQARWQQAAKADAADTSAIVARAYGFADEVAEKLGLSRRAIYLDLALHRRLLPDVVAALRGHPVATNAAQLRALAKLSEADQRAVVARLLDHSAKTPTEALALIGGRQVMTSGQKAKSAFFGSWSRMSEADRRQALKELAGQLPTGIEINFDGERS